MSTVTRKRLGSLVINSIPNPSAAQHRAWLKPLWGDGSESVLLVCFPFAGGGTSAYRFWSQQLPSRIGVSAVLLPGRETRISEAPTSDINVICDNVIADLLRHYRSKQLIFFGHSMGCMLAYEIGVRLDRQHHWPIAALIASGRKPPHICGASEFHKASESDFVREIQRLGGTPESLLQDEEMRNILLPVLRSDYALLETYRCMPPKKLNCPVFACFGGADSEMTAAEMQRWKELTHNQCVHRVFDGGHFYLSEPRNQKALGNYFAEMLNQLDTLV